MAVAFVSPLSQAYVYGILPPVTVTVAEPSPAPLHVTALACTAVAARTAGSPMVTVAEAVHPLLSVISTTCRPPLKPVAVGVMSPLSQAYVYGKLPPVTLTVADPSPAPLQVTAEFCAAVAARTAGSSMFTVAEVVHPLLSVISTTCRPPPKPVAVAVMSPLSQAYVYGKFPPVTVTVAEPSPALLHVTALFCAAAASRISGSSMFTVAEVVHPLLSVMSTTCI